MEGKGMLSHALQGMKPHHAAAKWNFVNFQTPTYSAIMMEFTTPPSYGKTSVNVGGIAKDGEIVCGGASTTIKHLAASQDSENDWPEPKAILCEWTGQTVDGKDVKAEIMGELPPRHDRVDVLAHIPGFVKTIVGGVVGTKPYIYQVCNVRPSIDQLTDNRQYSAKDKLNLKIEIGDSEVSEPGWLFSEATFIS